MNGGALTPPIAPHCYLRLVVVWGRSNSLKTTAIKRYLEKYHGIRCVHQTVHDDTATNHDVTVVVPLARRQNYKPNYNPYRITQSTKEHICSIGVASGGDTVEFIQANLEFLYRKNCCFIVCAASGTEGARTLSAVETFAKDRHFELQKIPSTASRNWPHPQKKTYIEQLADTIWHEIRR